MDKNETLRLYRKGKDSWNKWALNLLEEKKLLQDLGKWESDLNPNRGVPAYYFEFEGLIGLNKETTDWLLRACVDFSNHTFEKEVDFSGLIIPEKCDFSNAIFKKKASFKKVVFKGDSLFKLVKFNDEAIFKNAAFEFAVRFSNTEFLQDAYFEGVKFSDEATFESTIFKQRGWFGSYPVGTPAQFLGDVDFTFAVFEVGVNFAHVKFEKYASFYKAEFKKFAYFNNCFFEKAVNFKESSLGGWVNFKNSFFKGISDFGHLKILEGSEFNLEKARFKEVPNFQGAKLLEIPRLDNIQIDSPLFGLTKDVNASAKFRILKKFAVENKDHKSEIQCFANEIKTARFHQDKLTSARLWFGILFELFSNFGMSILRPAFFLFFVFLVFGVYYLGQHKVLGEERQKITNNVFTIPTAYLQTTYQAFKSGIPCDSNQNDNGISSIDAVSQAFVLSIKNTFPIPRSGTSLEDSQISSCLFGTQKEGGNKVLIPSNITFWSTVQSILSAILIFFMGLGLRNMLRMT